MIIILQGGNSAEREVSLKTGASIAKALISLGRAYTVIDAADADWLEQVLAQKPEAVLIALHGTYGEDGTVQRMLEASNLPYSGSNSESSARAMDKQATKAVAAKLGIIIPEGVSLHASDTPVWSGAYPVVVKPNANGSSFGVTIAKSEPKFLEACKAAFSFSDAVLVETYITGTEYSCGVVEMEDGLRALPLIEIRPKTEFFDYTAKYTASACDEICPAGIDAELAARIQQQTLAIFTNLGCAQYARADWIVDAEGAPYFLEINTLPGMTETSLLPKELAAAGIGYEAFIEQLVTLAKER